MPQIRHTPCDGDDNPWQNQGVGGKIYTVNRYKTPYIWQLFGIHLRPHD